MAANAVPTTRVRLTQQQRSAATREALIDATIECLMDVGYERATTADISERAGLSRGAHLHHFQTRAALVAAAVKVMVQRGLDDIARGVRRLPQDERRHAAALDLFWRLFNDRLFHVMVELSVHGRTDPQLRAELDPIKQMAGHESPGHESMPRSLRVAFAGDADDHRLDDLISLIVAATRGLALMKLIEPSREINARWEACRAQLLALLDQRGR
ncbi:MAG TPA: helix-turn-helix domain-containing protein [Solirubrobacteraceae bacterium]|jgi:AcrR family transcriptional regulator|nr:helix-turn-helix domain-containing protein [Solirubrobacteraceae bacterium]